MIVVIEDRRSVGEAYAAGLAREGVSAAAFASDEFCGWFATVSASDLAAIEAILIGDNHDLTRGTMMNLIRQRSTAAVIALCERRSLEETLLLLASGCDDVVTKPVHARELLARSAAIRTRRAPAINSIDCAGIRIFDDGRDPEILGTPLSLPRRERRVLECLARKSDAWISKSQIFNNVYGLLNEGVDDTVVETHISRLRAKLNECGETDPIVTVRGGGYMIRDAS